jgi:hypothetical protein
MTPQQTKIALAAAALVLIVGGLAALNYNVTKKDAAAAARDSELASADTRHDRLGVKGSHGGPGSADDNDPANAKNGKNRKAGGTASSDSDLASIIDAATTTVQPIETEVETRERQRYEEAMANQFKYREVDPSKIKPVEVGPALQNASKEYGIPDNLLAAMMYVETGGTHRDGDHSMEAGYGVMNLRENNTVDTLGEAASLLGKSKDDVLYDQGANIKAAGALLRSYYDDALASGLSDKEAWYMAVSQYSGRSDPDLAAALADETAGWMLRGFEIHLSDGGGDLIVPPSTDPVFLPKNWELVGMNPPSAGSGPVAGAGTTPPNGQGYGSATGGNKVTP